MQGDIHEGVQDQGDATATLKIVFACFGVERHTGTARPGWPGTRCVRSQSGPVPHVIDETSHQKYTNAGLKPPSGVASLRRVNFI